MKKNKIITFALAFCCLSLTRYNALLDNQNYSQKTLTSNNLRSTYFNEPSDYISMFNGNTRAVAPTIYWTGVWDTGSSENNVHWVNLNDYFGIGLDFYMPRSSGSFPNYSRVDLYDSSNVSHEISANNDGSYVNTSSTSLFNTDFDRKNATSEFHNNKNTEWNSNSTRFFVKPKIDGKTYTVWYQAAKGSDFTYWFDSGIKIKTDGKRPVIKFLNDKPYEWVSASSYTLNTSATDEGSGVSRFRYYTSGAQSAGDWQEGYSNMSLTINKQGLTNVSIFAIDKAGNKIEESTYVRLDNKNPGISISSSNTNWTNNNITLTASASDSNPGSGVKNIVNPSGNSYYPGDSVFNASTTFNISSNGTYKFNVYDHAGNSSSSSITVSNIDKVNPTASLSPNSSSWINRDLSVNVNVSDNASGVQSWKYSISSDNGASWGGWTNGYGTSGTINLSSNGTFKVKVEVKDNAGNINTITSGSYQIDKTNPTSSFSPYNKTWTNSNVSVSLSVNDTVSGIKSWRYSISTDDGSSWGNWINGSGTSSNVTLSNNGLCKIKIEATDNAGNTSTTLSGSYQIDKINPTVLFSSDSESWSNSYISVIMYLSDNSSGIKSWRYCVSPDDGLSWGSWVSGTGYASSTTITTVGSSKIKVEAMDYAGNSITSISGSYQIDKTKPTISLNPNNKSWTNSNVSVSINLSDDLSGIDYWRYAISSNDGSTYGSWVNGTGTSGLVTLSTEGIFKIKVEAVDKAENSNILISGSYKIDKTNPNITYNPMSRPWLNTDVVVNMTPYDLGGSTLNTWEYRISENAGSTWGNWNYNQPESGVSITFSSTGQWLIEAKMTDVAGNVFVSRSGLYLIDKVQPTANIFIPPKTNSRNILVNIENIAELDSGIKEVTIGNYKTDASAITKQISNQTNLSIPFELNKRDTIEENYGERNVYLSLKDNAGNVKEYALTTILVPKKTTPPIIKSPKDDSLYLLKETVPLLWEYKDLNNDFDIPLIKMEVVITNTKTDKTIVHELNGSARSFNIYDLDTGTYSVSVKSYISNDIYSESTPISLRINIFKKKGNVKTISILPGSKIRYLAILTESEIPKGTSIEGKIYYKALPNSSILDKTNYIPFVLTTNYRQHIMRLPENSSKVEVEYFLSNNSDTLDLSPILDHITVFAR